MKKKITTLVLLAFVSICLAQQKKVIPSFIHPILKERPADYEYLSAPDSLGKRKPLKTPSQTTSTGIHLPYPIILLHGINSSSETWDTLTNFFDNQYGFNYGGRFDVCLNSTGDYTVANTDWYPATNADITMFTGTWTAGDYYTVNFKVGNDGSVFPLTTSPYYVESNCAAVVKQAVALQEVINQVLQLTGRDKVILLAHSMGGLASREYLQNALHWQSDGQCHVAKLATAGTPNGGSNVSLTDLLDQYFSGVDDRSEAVRDTRTSYQGSKNKGVYLFGGLEDLTYMDDNNTLGYFYNADVNCNGVAEEQDTGLNQRPIHTDLDYSCIIGECLGCYTGSPGDGLVKDSSANINNFYPGLTTNLFYYHAFSLTDIHTALPKQVYQLMQGLDEPNEYSLAYHVGIDTNYMGFTTVQNDTAAYDYDDFKFSLPAQSNLTVIINNIYMSD